jgi:hypothetical protein
MGQLDAYSLEDLSIITILCGPFSTYFVEEIEISIESIVAYAYSANLLKASKKRVKFISIVRLAGDVAGAIHTS